MNRRIYLRLENGNYSAVGSVAELSLEDVKFAVDSYNKSSANKLLYFEKEAGDVCLTDEMPAFVQGKPQGEYHGMV